MLISPPFYVLFAMRALLQSVQLRMVVQGPLITLHFPADKAGVLRGRQLCQPPLFEHNVDLAVPAAEVVEQVPLPGQPRPAQLALQGRHTLRELRGQVLHEVVAVVHLQIVLLGLQGLAAHLTLPPSSVPGPCSPSIRGEQGRWNRMGVVITAQDKSLDVTFSINEGGLLLIFTFTVWYNKMFNIAI